jgi:hypothetical protein
MSEIYVDRIINSTGNGPFEATQGISLPLRETITGGFDNFLVGTGAGNSITEGSGNNFLGPNAGYSNTTGSNNNFFGPSAGYSNTTGSNNNFIGNNAGYGVSTGFDNIAIGNSAMSDGANFNNIAIGNSSGISSPIGLVSLGSSSNTIVIGNADHTDAYINIGWTVTSDERDKGNIKPISLGLNFVQKIVPIEYNWIDRNTKEIRDNTKRYGFSAQNILENEINPSVLVDTRNPEYLKIRESMIIPILVNAINELAEKITKIDLELQEIKGSVGVSTL